MTTPTQPTVANIVAEAFAKVGIASPTTAQTARVTAYHMEELKNDIWTRAGRMGNQRLKSLQDDYLQMTSAYNSYYSFSTDFDEEITISYLDGTYTGTFMQGTTVTLTVSTTSTAATLPSESGALGKLLLVNSSTAGAFLRQITAYSTTSGNAVFTIDSAWDTPSTGGTYRVIEELKILDEDNELETGMYGTTHPYVGDPDTFTKFEKDGTAYFALNSAPSVSTKGLLVRYYKDLMKVSTISSEYNKLLYHWRAPITVGLAARIAEDNDDTKSQIFRTEYERLVQQLLDREIPYGGEFEGFTL